MVSPLYCFKNPASFVRKLCFALGLLLVCSVSGVVPVCLDIIWIQHSSSADPFYQISDHGKLAYIDQSGKIVVRPERPMSIPFIGGDFHNGMFLVTNYPCAEFMDLEGKLVRFPDVCQALDFSESLAAAQDKKSQKWGFIDTKGDFVIPPSIQGGRGVFVGSFSDGLALYLNDPLYGFIDRTGALAIPVQFLDAYPFREGFARVVIEGPCLSRKGSCSFPGPFVLPFGSGARSPVPDCKYAFVDHSGNPISSERFDDASDFSEGLAAVMVKGKWGFIDKTGALVVKPQFESTGMFSDGLSWVLQNGSFGFIDHNGELVIAPQFKYVQGFVDGLALVGDGPFDFTDGHSYWYVDRTGRRAFSDSFPLATSFFKGLAHVKLPPEKGKEKSNLSSEKFAYIDRTGKAIFIYEREQR
jgi:hypothetical protein